MREACDKYRFKEYLIRNNEAMSDEEKISLLAKNYEELENKLNEIKESLYK